MPVNLLRGAGPDINPWKDADDLVGFLQIVFHAEQPDVLYG